MGRGYDLDDVDDGGGDHLMGGGVNVQVIGMLKVVKVDDITGLGDD